MKNHILKFLLLSILFLLSSCTVHSSSQKPQDIDQNFSPKELLQFGERIYNTAGANTCLMCHGRMGRGGSIAEAPRLNEPKKWDIYKALGGDVAFKENPEEMKKQMQTVHLALIRYGSIYWNKERDQIHPEIKLNFSLTDDPHGVLDPLMYGIQQAPTLITIKKIQGEIKKNRGLKIDKNEMYWLAAHSVYQYVKTFDQGGPIGGIFVSENK